MKKERKPKTLKLHIIPIHSPEKRTGRENTGVIRIISFYLFTYSNLLLLLGETGVGAPATRILL